MGYFTKRYHAPGTAPGTLVQHEAQAPGAVRIHLLDYNPSGVEERPDIAAADCREYLARPTTTWIHVQGAPDPDFLGTLGELFGLHPLAMEDVLNSGQRPKAEAYDSQLFVILSLPVQQEGAITTEQVSLFAGEGYAISFYDGPADPFEPVRKRIRAPGTRFRARKSDYLLYTLIDSVIDQGFPVLEQFGERIEELEDTLLESPDKALLHDIHGVKRELLLLRRMLWPEREVLNGLLRDDHEIVAEETRLYLRDCYDHTIQVMDLVETYRDMAASMLDVYLSSVSNRLNEVMRVLTVIATVFIPPTFLVGVYGMNFDRGASPWNMPELGWPYGYAFAWCIIAAMVAGMMLYFKREKWF